MLCASDMNCVMSFLVLRVFTHNSHQYLFQCLFCFYHLHSHLCVYFAACSCESVPCVRVYLIRIDLMYD